MACENSSKSLTATTMASLTEPNCSARHREIVDQVAAVQKVIEALMEVVVQTAIALPKDVGRMDAVVLKVTDRQKVEVVQTEIVDLKVALVGLKPIALLVVPLAEEMRMIAHVMKSLVKGTNLVKAITLHGNQSKSQRDVEVTLASSFQTLNSPAFLKSRAAFMNGE
jgi:hypothetical protein